MAARNNDQQPAEAPTWFDEWAGRTPPVTRYVLYTFLGLSLTSWLTSTSFYFANCVVFTVFRLQLWRLITAPFIARSILGGLFGGVIFASMGPKRERELGSVGFAIQLAIYGFGSHILYTTASIVLGMLGIMPMMGCAAGLGVVWIAMMTCDCAMNPEQERRLLFFPIQIKGKYYPLVLIGLFSLIFGFRLESFAAVGIGYAYAFGYLDFVKATVDRLRQLETGRLSFMGQWQGYIAVDEAGAPAPAPGADVEQGGGATGDVFGRGRRNQGGAGAAQRPTTAFPGSGQALGDAPSSRSAGRGGGSGGAGGSNGKGSKTATAAATQSRSRDQTRKEMLAALERRLAAGSATASPAPTAAAAPARGRPSTKSGFGAPTATAPPPSSALDPPVASASAPPATSRHQLAVVQLQEVGFSRDAAVAAVQQTNGDFDAALALLTNS